MMTLLAFLVTLGVLIVVHEYGHFYAAKRCGVKVLQFSIGFGKPLYQRRFGADQAELIVAAFPLGGYVKMLDEREAPVPPEELHRAFNRQSVWKRILIVAAGPLSNLLLAVLLYWVLFMAGLPGLRPLVGEVAAGTPAAAASIKAEELIVRVGAIPVKTWNDVRWALLQESLSKPQVEIEARSGTMETHLHRLNVTGIRHDDAKVDVLDQLGLQPLQPTWSARVGVVQADSPAERAGLKPGDEVVAINGIAVAGWEDFSSSMRQNPGKTLSVKVLREGREFAIKLTPEAIEDAGKTIGRVGAAYVMSQAEIDRYMIDVQYDPFSALWQGGKKTWETSLFSIRMFGAMLTGTVSWKSLGGPVTIGDAAGKSAEAGWKVFLAFLALVSISLGVLNLLPVPVLDGGHLMYYMVEILRGKPVSDRTMEIGMRVGFFLLGLLMIIAISNDINRLITG